VIVLVAIRDVFIHPRSWPKFVRNLTVIMCDGKPVVIFPAKKKKTKKLPYTQGAHYL